MHIYICIYNIFIYFNTHICERPYIYIFMYMYIYIYIYLYSYVIYLLHIHIQTAIHFAVSSFPSTFQYTATQYNTLQDTTTHYSKLCCLAASLNKLQGTATHCNTLQNTTLHYNTLQYTATHLSALLLCSSRCNTLQQTVTHYNLLQHILLPSVVSATSCQLTSGPH